MSCCADPCYKLESFSNCFTEDNPLRIGQIESVNTPIIIYVQNIATRRIDKYESVSNSSGYVDLFEENVPIYLPQHTPVRVWVCDESEPVLQLELTIDEEVYSCVDVSINR